MANASRPTSHWSSSRLPTSSNHPITPLIISRKKLFRLSKRNQPAFAEHMAKKKHEVEELFKSCCSNDSKLNTFHQTVTGTRISSPQAPSLIQNQFTNSSTDVFKSKHCVSREDINALDTHYDDYQAAINELHKLPIKRPVQVRNANSPRILQSASPLPILAAESISSNSNLTLPKKNLSLTRQDELPLIKSIAFLRNMPINSLEHHNTKKSKSSNNQRPISSKSSLTTLSSGPITTISSIINKKDPINLSHSSLSTMNSLQEQNQPNILTGTAIVTHQRLPTRSGRLNQRPKSNKTEPASLHFQQPNIKTSSLSNGSDVSQYPINIATQPVASIPSKYNRYVLITFPQASIRYNTPTYVERLLLPERFPILFQNITHHSGHNPNNK